jgi:hypothetical protein
MKCVELFGGRRSREPFERADGRPYNISSHPVQDPEFGMRNVVSAFPFGVAATILTDVAWVSRPAACR